MKRYEKYKPSGIEWIGDIPQGWKIKRLKYVSIPKPSNVDKKSIEGESRVSLCNYVDVYKNEFIVGSLNFMEATASADQIEKFSISKGDVIITKDSESANDIGVPAYVSENLKNVVCGYHLTLIKPINIYGGYLFRQFQCGFMQSYFEVSANGVTRYGIGTDKINSNLVLVPPIEEQQAIAEYLDEKCGVIDALIERKGRLLELYDEKRQAIINHAITRGIDPNAPLKGSGIPYLGQIPEHWEVKKLKYISSLKSGEGIVSEQIKEEGDYPVYGGNGLRGYFEEYTHDGHYVLVGRQGALCGNINYASGKFWASEHAIVCTLKADCNTTWFGELLRSMNLNQYSVSAAQPGLSVENIKVLEIGVPPLLEQTTIVSYIEEKCSKIYQICEKLRQQIELYREYRSALIANAVTGKIKIKK